MKQCQLSYGRKSLLLLGWVLALLWGLSGCVPGAIVQPVAVPLPTRPPVATATAVLVTPVPVPPTFTPLPLGGAAMTETAVATATPTETAVPLPTWTPTVNVLPEFLVTVPANAPYLPHPPVSTDCGEEGTLFRSQFPSSVGGPWRDYHAYLPPCYGDDGRVYPVMYLFHGSIQTDSHWVDLGLKTLLDRTILNGRMPPVIVIMPFNGLIGNTTSGNTHSIEGITVDSLLPFVDETFCTWRAAEGRSIGGISRGGYWALMIAFLHPDLFTAVSGHSSQLRFETDNATYNPLATYATADLSNMRIWMDWGETDFLRTGQQQLSQALQEINADLTLHVNGGGHNDAYWMVHMPAYLQWHTQAWSLDRQSYAPCRGE